MQSKLIIKSLIDEDSLQELYKMLPLDEKLDILLPYIWLSRDSEKIQALSDTLSSITTKNIASVDLHTNVRNIFNIKMVKFWKNIIPESDVKVAPDKGAYARSMEIDFGIVLNKTRTETDLTVSGDCSAITPKMDCTIVDDIIDTGKTVLAVTELLYKSGAKSVSVCATHGVLSGKSIENLQNSDIKNIYITNTIPQKKLPKKFIVLKIEDYIAENYPF
ncbi:MAG: hypothetical protein LBI26_00990 [Holosporales bacterium]|jgi:ribose-phosphate pyrophosphokinase|nr:hypothetical protein [Holosporales bacterium]